MVRESFVIFYNQILLWKKQRCLCADYGNAGKTDVDKDSKSNLLEYKKENWVTTHATKIIKRQ